jgi:hypothetical protein
MMLTILKNIYHVLWSRDSAISVVSDYGLDGRGVGFWVPAGARFLLSPCRPDRFWGLPSLLWEPGVKWPGCDADHSPPTSVEVKNTWISPMSSWHSTYLVEYRDNFMYVLNKILRSEASELIVIILINENSLWLRNHLIKLSTLLKIRKHHTTLEDNWKQLGK